jgi:hypothetical protein
MMKVKRICHQPLHEDSAGPDTRLHADRCKGTHLVVGFRTQSERTGDDCDWVVGRRQNHWKNEKDKLGPPWE